MKENRYKPHTKINSESDCCLMPNEAIFQPYHGENM